MNPGGRSGGGVPGGVRARRAGSPAPAAGPGRTPARGAVLDAAVLLSALGGALLVRYRDAFSLPFLNDDYVFLDATARRGVLALWGFARLPFDWWRPWSREFHYWLLQRLAGPSAPVFHAVNFALALAALALFHDLARALVGRARGALATAGAAAMAAWALPLLWAAGSQDLWMLVCSLAALAAWRRGQRALAFASYALALASKETAAPLPALLFAWDVLLARRRPADALRRLAPAVAIALAWGFAHPQLGGHYLRHLPVGAAPPGARLAPGQALLRGVLALASLDARPAAPAGAWAGAIASALLGGGAVAWCAGRRGAAQRGEYAAGAVAAFGVAWLACGWASLLLPGLGWHAYYGLFGALGAWLALAAVLPAGPVPAAALVAALGLTSALRDAAPSLDWGDASYQRRAGALLSTLRGQLLAAAPSPAPGTRFYFSSLPDHVGFMQGDGPALRTWYRDPSLSAGFYSAWRPRPAGQAGEDRFFKFKPGAGLVELHAGAEDVPGARAANPGWPEDHLALALVFVNAAQWARARDEFQKVADAAPRLAEPAYNVSVCCQMLGDAAGQQRWLLEASRRPVVSERLRRAARASGLRYW